MPALLQAKITISQLDQLFKILKAQGYDLIGPKVDGKAITYDPITGISDLPQGWTDEQDNGYYRLKKRPDKAFFGYNLGSRSFKQFLFPPKEKLFSINQDNTIQNISVKKQNKLALIGVRACELSAILIQDKVFHSKKYSDPRYMQRRNNSFIVALNCHTTVKTCFCASMNTGPEVTKAYDLNLSEILTDKEHYFICEAGSKKGEAILNKITFTKITPEDNKRKQNMIAKTTSMMGRSMDTSNIKQKLYDAHNHPHWDKIADKCINCSNCTMACPTCFCSTTEDDSNLDQTQASRTKVWDSCFSQQHSSMHNAYVRETSGQRYRQWMTHKLASWHDQFDTSGCVGCGRCIAWCPVGIDITEEIRNFTDDSQSDVDGSQKT